LKNDVNVPSKSNRQENLLKIRNTVAELPNRYGTPVKKLQKKTVKKGELSSLPQLFPGSEATIMDNFRECNKTSTTIK
jgi:hypothetical protein